MGIQIGVSKLSLNDRVDFFKNLGSWLNSGGGRTSVAEAVTNTCDAFSHDEYKTLKPKMDMIRNEVRGGQLPLYQALRMSDLGFQKQELAIIEAAERSSQLRQSIPALVEALSIQQRTKREMTMKLMGPVVVGIALIGMTLGVLLYMLPLIVGPTIERNPAALGKFPVILQMYWYISAWLLKNTWFLFVFFGTPTVLFLLRNTPLLRQAYQTLLMSWSLSRRLIISFNSVLTAFFLPALARSGMPTYEMLRHLSECVSNPTISALFKRAAQSHEDGLRMSEALRIIPFRASFHNAVVAGEATGSIADRVSELQENYSLEMERQVKMVVGALKFLVMAILLPIFVVSTYTALVGPIFALLEY